MNRCVGCGVVLQNECENDLGYVADVNKNLCTRCFRLKNYGEYNKVTLGNEEYIKIIDSIPDNSLVLYISDVLSLDLSYIDKFKRVLLVVTKRDIIPRSVNDDKIIRYVKDRVKNIIDVVLVSSKNNYNIDYLYNCILKYSNNSDIYFVGNTNSGKSTLVNKLLSNYSDNIGNVTVSMFPSTTLDKVVINLNQMVLIDTPGIIDDGSVINYLKSKDLKLVVPKKEIKPKSCQISGCGSIIIGEYARVDYDTVSDNSMVIYASNMIDIRFSSLSSNKFNDFKVVNFKLDKNKDVVIPGLCFIKCRDELNLKVYVFDKVIPYVRDNLI